MSDHKTKSYADFGMERSLRQIRHAWNARREAETDLAMLFQQVCRDERRMEEALARELSGLEILEIGPGQGKERAAYFGMKNQVTAIDLDVIPTAGRVSSYWKMYRTNGASRVVKTLGRDLMIGRRYREVWAKTIGAGKLRQPRLIQGDICGMAPDENAYDVVMSWSVFEHLPDPASAVKNLIKALRVGGIFFLSIHLYTSNNGHHDIRAFTGGAGALPMWAHLRPKTRELIHPSAYLNEWRLSNWRRLFEDLAPGTREYLEQYEHPEQYGPLLTGELRQELSAYAEEELLTVNAVYIWKKTGNAESI